MWKELKSTFCRIRGFPLGTQVYSLREGHRDWLTQLRRRSPCGKSIRKNNVKNIHTLSSLSYSYLHICQNFFFPSACIHQGNHTCNYPQYFYTNWEIYTLLFCTRLRLERAKNSRIFLFKWNYEWYTYRKLPERESVHVLSCEICPMLGRERITHSYRKNINKMQQSFIYGLFINCTLIWDILVKLSLFIFVLFLNLLSFFFQ